MTTPETCPRTSQYPPATIDEDGFCTEHGWDCKDYSILLDEADPARKAASVHQSETDRPENEEAFSRWGSEKEFLTAAGIASDECRQQSEEEDEQPPPADEAFIAGARWALGQAPELDVPAWTFFGYWDEDDQLVIDHHIAGEHEDLREDAGHHPGGLWCASARAADAEKAEARLREIYY